MNIHSQAIRQWRYIWSHLMMSGVCWFICLCSCVFFCAAASSVPFLFLFLFLPHFFLFICCSCCCCCCCRCRCRCCCCWNLVTGVFSSDGALSRLIATIDFKRPHHPLCARVGLTHVTDIHSSIEIEVSVQFIHWWLAPIDLSPSPVR